MMNDELARELIELARKSGADEAVIVHHDVACRSDSVYGHSFFRASASDTDVAMHFAVGDSESSFVWPVTGPMPSRERFRQGVADMVQAAKLARVWGTTRAHAPFAQQYGTVSAQQCAEIQQSGRENCKRQCRDGCFAASCMSDMSYDAAPILNTIVARLDAESGAELHGIHTIRRIRQTCWFGEQTTQTTRYETTLSQTLIPPGDSDAPGALVLPDYRFDGYRIDPDDAVHKPMLLASDIAPQYLAPREKTASGLYGLLLSPWIVAVLAHLSSHLDIDVTVSGKLLQNLDICLFAPPVFQRCLSRALVHSVNARPTLSLLFARTPSHALFVDAPSSWTRRNEFFVEMTCQIACEIDEHQFRRYFMPVTLRVDLRDLWQHCTETAEPSRRFRLGCPRSGSVIYQTPFAYFDMRPVFS